MRRDRWEPTRRVLAEALAGSRGTHGLRVGLALAVVVSGCTEWRKYWEPSVVELPVVRDTTAPTVSIQSPSGPDRAHATPVSGTAFVVAIDVRDDHGVARVELHIDDRTLRVSAPPWRIPWDTSPAAEGAACALWATAVDVAGNLAVSDTVFARVFNSGPSVVLSEPEDGARARGRLQVSAGIVGPAPDLAAVDFLADAQPIGTATSAPWSISIDTSILTPGDHYLIARATTQLGAVGASPPRRISVNNGSPAVTILFPLAPHRLAPRGTLILSAGATDEVEGEMSGGIVWTSSLDGPIGSGSYLRIRGLSVGTHTLVASAVNAWGSAGQATISVEVLASPTYGFRDSIAGEILGPRCVTCHNRTSPYWPAHQLDLTSYAGLMAGGRTRSHEAIVPCRPESSLVWNKITQEIPWVGDPMPPRDAPVEPDLLTLIRTWILEGAPDDP